MPLDSVLVALAAVCMFMLFAGALGTPTPSSRICHPADRTSWLSAVYHGVASASP
jgi:hypothetical protein